MAEQSIGMSTGLGDGTAGGYTADRMRDMEARTFGDGIFLNSDGSQPFTMTGSGTSTLTIGIGNANVAGFFYQNTTAATISVATGVTNATYYLIIVANNSASTAAVTKTVAGVATVPAYTVRLALASAAQLGALTYQSIGTCVVTGGVLSAFTYDENEYMQSLLVPYQTGYQMNLGAATLTTASTTYDITTYTLVTSNSDGIFSANTGTGVITVNRTGWYQITGQGRFQAGTTSWRRLVITINAVQVWRVDAASIGVTNHFLQVAGLSYLTTGDTVKLQATSGLAAQSIDATTFTITLV